MTNKQKQIELKDKLTKGLDKVYEKLIDTKKREKVNL